MFHSRLLAFTVPALLLLVQACGDDGGGSDAARFGVVITAPTSEDIVFPGVPVRFEASVAGLADDFDPATVRYTWSFGDGESVSTASAATDHTFPLDGTYGVTLTAEEVVDEAVRSSATAELDLTVVRAPDIQVGPVTVTLGSTTVSSGDSIRVSFDVRSDAAAGDIPVGFDVGIWLVDATAADTVNAPTDETVAALVASGDAIALASESFDAFSAGDQANVDRSELRPPEDLPSGEYVVLVYADPDRTIGESSRANNGGWGSRGFAWINTSDVGPDLIATDILVRPARVNALTSVTLDASIRNVGNQPALLFDYRIWLSAGSPDLDEADILLGSGSVNNVAPGLPFVLDDAAYPVDPAISELGEYYVLVEVDTGGTVDETSEDNNVGASQRILVTDEPVPGIDLVIDAFEAAPRSTFVAGSVALTATVRNQGTQDVDRQSFCRVHVSPDPSFDGNEVDRALDSLQVPALRAGEAIELERVARVPSWIEPGEYVLFLDCDPSRAIPESDETNNLRRIEGTINVAGEANVELVAGEVSVSPSEVENDALVTVSVEICNEGSNGSTPSVVRVHISPDASFETSDTVLLQSRVPPIEPSACVTVRADVPAVCDTFESLYTVFVRLDANEDVPEPDEDNNLVTLPDPLRITGLICACEVDRYEPNDSLARAAYLNPSNPDYVGLSMCEIATDWYRLPLLRGESVRVAITFDSDRGNLDMTLFGTDRSSVLATSTTDGDREEVAYFVAPQSGDYYLKVFGREETDRNVYDLRLDVTARVSGTDLIVVAPTISNPAPVLGEAVQVTFDAVNLGDTPAAASLARLYYTVDTVVDPVADRLIGEIALDAFPDRLRRSVTVTLPDDVPGGESYVGVLLDARSEIAELEEDNNTGVTPRFELSADCYDALEPNNTLDDARLLEPAGAAPWVFTDLLACSSNRDVYEFCGRDGEFLDVLVTFDDGDGDIDLKLYDDVGREIDRSEGVGPEERVGIDYITGERCYRLEVYVAGRDREVPYTMTVDAGTAPDELACSRIEEPNDDFPLAVDLAAFFDEDLAVCPVEDTDFFRLPLAAGSTVTLRLVPADGADDVPSQLRLALFSPSRNFITSTVSATETISHRASTTGTHFVRVRSNGDGPRNQAYRVEASGVPGVDLVATDLVLEPEAASPGDEVRFTWTVSNARDAASAAAKYAVWLSDDAVLDTESDTLLRELDLAPVGAFATREEGRRFTVPSTLVDGGDFTVFVVADSRDTVTEFVERNNTAAAELVVNPRCPADAAEPNNFSFEAVDVDDLAGADLVICPDDVDWFTFTPAAAGNVTVSIDFAHGEGDLDLYVFADPLGAPIAFSDGVSDGESVTFAAIAAPYWIRVDSFYRETAAYTLTVD